LRCFSAKGQVASGIHCVNFSYSSPWKQLGQYEPNMTGIIHFHDANCWHPSSSLVFSGVHCAQSLVFCVVFYRSLFALCRLAIVLSLLRLTLFGTFKLFQWYDDEVRFVLDQHACWIFIVLAHWNNSSRIDMSLHSVTLSWFRANIE
jgi:hypothetical protein